jgi:anti-sigma B factor antagonist
MLDDGLRIDAHHTAEGLVLAVRGDIDLGSAPALRSVVNRTIATTGRLALDLSGVTFMDSSGLHVLCSALRVVGDENLVLHNPSRIVSRLLELASLDHLVAKQEMSTRTSWLASA